MGLFPDEIESRVTSLKKFKCTDIFKSLSRGIFDSADFTTLSLKEREYLSTEFKTHCLEVLEKKVETDGSLKISLKLFDQNIIEAVLLNDGKQRKTACLSSQVGCPLACAFCKTGHMGFARNLFTGEIVEQFFILEKIAGSIDNIVFMGMGEPLLNLPNLAKAIKILSHKAGRSLSLRRITISTAGVIAGIDSLAEIFPEIRLAVSLTTANEALRKQLMPITESNPLAELKACLKRFAEKTKRRITLELALMHRVNTERAEANAVISFAREINAHVNLIPWNEIPELNFKTPDENELIRFENWLKDAHINVTRRAKHGGNISAACGQLGKIIPPQ